jgi:hypothetical protein
MKRRRFLQLAASTAAVALVERSSALSESAAADVLSLALGEPPLAPLEASQAGFNAGPSQMIEMLLEKTSSGAYQWTIDRETHPAQALPLQQGRPYRLRIMNATGEVHTVRLRRHSFGLARIHQAPISGIFQNAIRLGRYDVVEADVLMSRPGPLLLHYAAS